MNSASFRAHLSSQLSTAFLYEELRASWQNGSARLMLVLVPVYLSWSRIFTDNAFAGL